MLGAMSPRVLLVLLVVTNLAWGIAWITQTDTSTDVDGLLEERDQRYANQRSSKDG